MADERIVLEIDFDNRRVKSAFDDIDEKAQSTGKKSGDNFQKSFKQSSLPGIKKTALAIGAALAAAGAAATAAIFNRAVSEAKTLENSLVGLSSVTRNLGHDQEFITQSAKDLAADGLIPLADVAASLKNLLATGLDGQQAVETFKNLREAAAFNRQGQLELGEAVRAASEGLKNDLSIKVDNAGITKNLSVIQKEYAASIGTSAARLTEQQRAQAKYVGIAKEAALFQGDYNKLLNTFSGASSRVSGELRFFLAELGSIVTKSPLVVEGISSVATVLKSLRNTIRSIDILELNRRFLTLAEVLVGFVGPQIELVANSFRVLRDVGSVAVMKLTNVVFQSLGVIGQRIAQFFPGNAIAQKLQEQAAQSEKMLAGVTSRLNASIDGIFNFETTSALDARIQALRQKLAEAPAPGEGGKTGGVLPPEQVEKDKTILENFVGFIQDKFGVVQEAASHLGKSILQGVGQGTSQAFAAFGSALAKGENAFDAFVKSFLSALGQMMIQQGAAFILQGLGFSVIPGLQASGGTLIATGAALSALGGVLTAVGGGAPGGGATSPAGGGGPIDAGLDTTPLDDDDIERQPTTIINYTVQGDVFENENTPRRLADLLNAGFERDNIQLRQRFA